MTDTLLRALRDTMLDETEPLAGLLRKCLLLGAETGSDALRDWARKELNGYESEDEVPPYRLLAGVPISMSSISGNTWATGLTVDRLQIPVKAREFVPESLPIKHPIEELERLSTESSLSFSTTGLAYAQTLWNRELDMFQQVAELKYRLSGSVFTGILGQVRTKLVDLIADLTAGTPLTELPGKGQVDEAVQRRMGDVYQVTVHAPSGPVAIGTRAKARSEGLSVTEVLELLDHVSSAAQEAGEEDRAQIQVALAEMRAALESSTPDVGEVMKKAGRLRIIAAKVGGAALMASTEGAVGAIAELAMSGVLG